MPLGFFAPPPPVPEPTADDIAVEHAKHGRRLIDARAWRDYERAGWRRVKPEKPRKV